VTLEMSKERIERLKKTIGLLPDRIVLKRGAVEAALDMCERPESGKVLIDLREVIGLPGGGAANHVLKSLQAFHVIDEESLSGARDGLVLKRSAYDLALVPSGEADPPIVSALKASYGSPAGVVSSSAVQIPWTMAEKEQVEGDDNADYSWLEDVYDLQDNATMDQFLSLPFPERRIATGVVLQPETPDGTRSKVPDPDAPEVVVKTDADVYTSDQILRALRFWMAYTRGRVTSGHMRMGGFDPKEDVRVLENTWTRGAHPIGDQNPKIGSWILSAWFPGDEAWARVESGEHKSFSLGSWFNYTLEKKL